MFYRYYDDKEDLLAALAESFLHDVVMPSGPQRAPARSRPEDSAFFSAVGDRVLEHVQAEHRHHDRRRPTRRCQAPVRRRAERVPALRHGHRRRIGAARAGAGVRRRPRPRPHRRGHRAAVRELHRRCSCARRNSAFRLSDADAITHARRPSGKRPSTASEKVAERNQRGFRAARTPSGPAGRDGRLHRGGDQAAGSRAHAVLRPATRVRPHRLGERRHPAAGLGGPARRDAASGRRGGLVALRPAVAVRRPRRHQPRHGRHPGTPGAQGARAAQRPAGRVVDRRQLPAGHHDGAVRHRRPEAGVDRGDADREAVDGVRTLRARPRLRRDVAGDHRRTRRRRLGDQRHEALEHRRAPRHPRPGLRAHVR